MHFSLIIVTYNSSSLINRCLEAIQTTVDATYEIIVVDNVSTDDTVALVRLRYPNVRVIVNQLNLGFGAACNVGIEHALGDVFVFMNPDVEPTPMWLQHLERHFNEYPDAAIICPTTLHHGQPISQRMGVAETAAVPGCALALRRTAWHEIGGFDPAMFLYWEDTELCWRTWLLGWRVLEDFAACVYHEKGASTKDGQWAVETAKNGLYTHIKLRRWRWVLRYSLRMLAKTVLFSVKQRNFAMLQAWAWNLKNLPRTLRQRRILQRRQRANLAHIEQLIRIHTARGKRERRFAQHT